MMLKSLFTSTPKWQSPKSQKRIEALAALDHAVEKELQILLKLARDDSEPAVRREAVKHLFDLDVIAQIQKRDLDASVREAAAARLQDLIAGKATSTLTQEQRLAGIRRINTPSMLVWIVREADHVDLKLAAIAELNDEMFLDDIARHSSIARLRLAAAERITTPTILEALAEASKQKDKNVYKALRARLDASSNQEKEVRALREKREALCEAMEHHARAALNPLYTAKAESLRQQWQEAQGADDAELAERFETAFSLVCKHIDAVASAAQREADEAQARVEMQEAVATLEDTLAAWQGQDDFDLPALAATRKTQRLRWEVATQLQTPPAALAQRHAAAESRLQALEDLLMRWQQDRPLLEASLAGLEQMADKEREQTLQAMQGVRETYRDFGLPFPTLLQQLPVAEGKKSRAALPAGTADKKALLEKLGTKLDALAASLKAGNTREAGKLLRKTQEFAREHQLQDARLGELAAQLQELKSWAGFAVQPKKEELIARMQALIAHAMDPDDKADAIHALQEEWKALGVADPTVEQPLWERFKAVGDEAFEPCRAHFAVQRELRQQNLEKREALCRQLDDYLSTLPREAGASIDWKQHEAILRTARKEWQQYHPSDRHKTKPLQDHFHATLEALEQPLRDAQKRHEAAKRALIQRTQQLLASADLRAACVEAKQFQQDWKTIGQAHPKVDHRLWQEFRAACDALFGKRDENFKQRQVERDAALHKAEELIASCTALATGDTRGLGSAVVELEDSFRALELPREQAPALKQRFQAARQGFELARRAQADAERREKRDARVREWEQKAQPAADPAKAGQLLLDLEILLELPSPAPLQEARRTRQMQRLQEKGLRKGSNEVQGLLAELLQTAPPQGELLPEMTMRLRQLLQKTEG